MIFKAKQSKAKQSKEIWFVVKLANVIRLIVDLSICRLTLTLPGTQLVSRSGSLRLRVRAEQPVNHR
jgi:hypothetical protein